MLPTDLARDWLKLAEQQDRLGATEQACTLRYCADELVERVREWEHEPLTLDQAAEESGYSYSALQQKVASGEIPNAGEQRRPRIRRGDLPRRTHKQRFELESGEPDLAAAILADKL